VRRRTPAIITVTKKARLKQSIDTDVTNGDAADGEDSGRGGPAGADGTAANGDAAGAGNNGNGNGNGNGNNS
jgi:hypothetical protein